MSDTISLRIPCNTNYISIARTTAALIASKLDFDIESIEDIRIAVSEACNNAIQHSQQNNSYFEIEYILEKNTFIARIIDSGKGYDENAYQEPDLKELNESGLGIFIMKALMDEVEINASKDEGTCVKLSKYIK